MKKKNKKSYEILSAHLKKLQKENPKFSARSLSLKLGLSPAFLTNVLSGKRLLPIKRLEAFCQILKIDEFDRHEIKKRLILEKLDLQNLTDHVAPNKSNTHQELLPEGQFRLMRYWWNFAILDLLTCFNSKGFTKVEILSSIPVQEAALDISLNELLQMNLIHKQNEFYFKTEEHLKLPTRGPNPVTRNFYKSVLTLAQQTLDKTDPADFEKRLITTISCAVNPAQVPKAKIRLAEALAEIRDILTEGNCTDVYFLQAQLFSVLK